MSILIGTNNLEYFFGLVVTVSVCYQNYLVKDFLLISFAFEKKINILLNYKFIRQNEKANRQININGVIFFVKLQKQGNHSRK